MIDVHCHLEQSDFDTDRDFVINSSKRALKAIITCCVHPKDFGLTLDLVRKHAGFVFATVGLHPEYATSVSEAERERFIRDIAANKESFVGIGEIGLDYKVAKSESEREKQKAVFSEFIELGKKLKLPLIIHSRNASEEVLDILKKKACRTVLLHLFAEPRLLQVVIESGWFVSLGPGVLRSKAQRKVAKRIPLERLLLETDSPWFPVGEQIRGVPLNIKVTAEEVAALRKVTFESVWTQTAKNAVSFFNLPLKL